MIETVKEVSEGDLETPQAYVATKKKPTIYSFTQDEILPEQIRKANTH
jgi:hypothetical protein